MERWYLCWNKSFSMYTRPSIQRCLIFCLFFYVKNFKVLVWHPDVSVACERARALRIKEIEWTMPVLWHIACSHPSSQKVYEPHPNTKHSLHTLNAFTRFPSQCNQFKWEKKYCWHIKSKLFLMYRKIRPGRLPSLTCAVCTFRTRLPAQHPTIKQRNINHVFVIYSMYPSSNSFEPIGCCICTPLQPAESLIFYAKIGAFEFGFFSIRFLFIYDQIQFVCRQIRKRNRTCSMSTVCLSVYWSAHYTPHTHDSIYDELVLVRVIRIDL